MTSEFPGIPKDSKEFSRIPRGTPRGKELRMLQEPGGTPRPCCAGSVLTVLA
jgi:hypothetical protein